MVQEETQELKALLAAWSPVRFSAFAETVQWRFAPLLKKTFWRLMLPTCGSVGPEAVVAADDAGDWYAVRGTTTAAGTVFWKFLEGYRAVAAEMDEDVCATASWTGSLIGRDLRGRLALQAYPAANVYSKVLLLESLLALAGAMIRSPRTDDLEPALRVSRRLIVSIRAGLEWLAVAAGCTQRPRIAARGLAGYAHALRCRLVCRNVSREARRLQQAASGEAMTVQAVLALCDQLECLTDPACWTVGPLNPLVTQAVLPFAAVTAGGFSGRIALLDMDDCVRCDAFFCEDGAFAAACREHVAADWPRFAEDVPKAVKELSVKPVLQEALDLWCALRILREAQRRRTTTDPQSAAQFARRHIAAARRVFGAMSEDDLRRAALEGAGQ